MIVPLQGTLVGTPLFIDYEYFSVQANIQGLGKLFIEQVSAPLILCMQSLSC